VIETFSDHNLLQKLREEQKRKARMANYKEKIRRYYDNHPEQKKIYHKRLIPVEQETV